MNNYEDVTQTQDFKEHAEYSSRFDVNADDIKNNDKINGVANFNTPEELFDFLDKSSTMTDEELEQWEVKNDFISQRSILNEAYSKLSGAVTEEEVYDVLDKYKNVLQIVNDVIVPKLDLSHYNIIVNKDGIYSVGNMVFKVTTNKQYGVTKRYYKILYSSNLSNMGIENQVYVSPINIPYFNENGGNSSAREPFDDGDPPPPPPADPPPVVCGYFYDKDYIKNVSGCVNDRKLYVKVYTYYLHTAYWESLDGVSYLSQYWKPFFYSGVFGYKNSLLCNWNSYETSIQVRNYHHVVRGFEWVTPYVSGNYKTNASPKYYEITNDDYNSPTDTYSIQDLLSVHKDFVKNEPELVLDYPQDFRSVHIEASSRGIGDYWLVIDCIE